MKIPGINQLNNFHFTEAGILVRRAYMIGDGKMFENSKLPLTRFIDMDGLKDEPGSVNSSGFACPEPGCQKEFVSSSGLERHILKGPPKYVKLSGTDVVKQMWVDKCNTIGSEYKTVIEQSCISCFKEDAVDEGWALKKICRTIRFSPKVKTFLKNIYDKGERTGKRPYYDEICERLRKQREDNGSKCFPHMNG